MRRLASPGLVLVLSTCVAVAIEPEFPRPAKVMHETLVPLDSYAMPVGPFSEGKVETRMFEGALRETAYQLDAPGVTTLELLQPLRAQIAAAGYRTLFECAADACGGYDFRFATRVVAEPEMHVDLADYRFVAAERQGTSGPEAISLMVSRSTLAGFVQIIEVGAVAPKPTLAAKEPAVAGLTAPQLAPVPAGSATALGRQLTDTGHVVLEDIVFASGASVLADGAIPSLELLADWLKEDGDRSVVLVGHTDASGNLAANVALGAKRAEAIRTRLIGSFGVAAGQVGAEGAGYLSPRASNLTDEGRRLNRRVEVVLLPPPP